MRRVLCGLAMLIAVPAVIPRLAAQGDKPLELGIEAPEFNLTGVTADGLLPEPVRLAEFRGQTVVIAFFFKARTKG